jgi:hypothetical protein
MSGVAGINGANLRIVDPNPRPDAAHVQVQVQNGGDSPVFNDKGAIVRIEHGDGAVTVSLNGRPIVDAANDSKAIGWFDNLAEHIDASEMSAICEDILQGVADDLQSRQDWIDDRAQGIKLLGLKIEIPNVQGSSDGAPVEGMSKVRHPLLLEAVLRFQANARSELLPTDGPVKIRNDSTSDNAGLDDQANALEIDMNHYLTSIATEYYPDTDRMLLMTGFGGDGFKKVYKCPLRRRPVSESVDAEDIIVNQNATDLGNAQRVTHRIMMRNSVVRRMQLLGHYVDGDLGTAQQRQSDALEEAKKEQQGLQDSNMLRPQDREREIYETYCELDIPRFEFKYKGEDAGLPVPYVVTIDKSDRKVLSIVRNYDEPEGDELPSAREVFVDYCFAPGLGFYSIGLLHILGNTTNAVTAAWRLMLDCGMFANFPGFLQSDSGARQNTNIFRVPPGGSATVKTNGGKIGDNIMPLPYTTQQMPALAALITDMAESGRRIGGTAEVQVGEGRADVPVGTVMAMIDQAIKVMNAVHKRMHAAQAREFQLLKRVFKENPESLLGRKCKSKTVWDKQKLLSALQNCDFVPQADPNTSSSAQRLMKIMGMFQLSEKFPQLFDPIKMVSAAMLAMGWSNPDEFLVPPAARAAPPPQLQEMQATMANDQAAAQAKTTEANARAAEAKAKVDEVQAKIAVGHYNPKGESAQMPPGPEPESNLDLAKAQATMMDAHTRRLQAVTQEKTQALSARRDVIEDENRDEDRAAREREAAIELAKEVIQDPSGVSSAGTKATKIINQVDKGIAGKKPRKPKGT